MSKIIVPLVLISLLVRVCPLVQGISAAERDLTLTTPQKNSLDKFKRQVEPLLFNDRFKTEAYLVRWLRASHWDVKRAEKMILENMRWRQQFRMDTINDENWSDFSEQFPYQLSIDKENQPVIFTQMGQWDFRKAILSGKRNKMQRYLFKMFEEIDLGVSEEQVRGNIVTRGNIIVDVEGYNLIQHGCVQCIALYIDLVLGMDKYYPGIYDKMILVNVPSTFEALLSILKQAMTPETKDALHVFGSNKQNWQNYLFKIVNSSELPIEFGGEKFNNEF